MNLDALLDWYAESPGDPHRLRALAASLGVELTRRRLDHVAGVLAALRYPPLGSTDGTAAGSVDPASDRPGRAGGARDARDLRDPRNPAMAPRLKPAAADVHDPRDARYRAGYLAALEDLLRSFQAELGEEQTEREILHYVKAEPYRSVLRALDAGAETATGVAQSMGKHKSSASRALRALRDAGLVTTYSAPDGNERQRPHALTLRGRRLVEEMLGRGERRGDGSRSTSAEKAAARKRTPGKGNKPAQPSSSARRGR